MDQRATTSGCSRGVPGYPREDADHDSSLMLVQSILWMVVRIPEQDELVTETNDQDGGTILHVSCKSKQQADLGIGVL